MFDTFLAVILMCALHSAPGTPFEDRCIYVQDKTGPSALRSTCQGKLDKMWQRIMDNGAFISATHKKIGDFRLIQRYHRGFCLDPQWNPEIEIQKYYDL
jgi:predicted secreted protein